MARFNEAKNVRSAWETHWQSVANLILPTRAFTVKHVSGAPRRNEIYNETAVLACESLAAALHGLLSNPSIRWMQLDVPDESDKPDYELEDWLYDSTTRMLAFTSRANSGFPTSSHELCLDLSGFGTGSVQILEKGNTFKFIARDLSNFYLACDDIGDVIGVFREFELTAMEILEMFGDDKNVPEFIIEKAKDPKEFWTKFIIVHEVTYRPMYEREGKSGAKAKPIASRYILSEQGHHLLRESGFNEWPYLTPRWSKAAEEPYGRGPGMMALPGVKTVNVMDFDVLMAGELAVRPPMMVPARGMEGPVRTAPGAANYYKFGTRDRPEPMLTGVNPGIGLDLIQHREAKIEKAFYLDAIRMPERDRMTAEEIITRRQQGLLQTSAVLSRLFGEWLTPAVHRLYRFMKKRRMLLPEPASLKGRTLDVHYTSPMALSQKAGTAGAFKAAMNDATEVIALRADVTDNIDPDYAFRHIINAHGVDPKVLRRPKDVKRLRKQREETEQLAIGTELAQGMAGAAKDAASAQKDLNTV